MKRNFFRTCMLTGAIGLFAACTDTPTSAPSPQIGPTETPAYDASTPFNNAGQCMADDAVRAPTGTISGVKFGDDPLTATNCTSKDVKIATAQVINYLLPDADGNFTGTPIPFDSTTNVTCTDGQQIQLTMSAKLNETAASARSDIGVWLATDGGKGITGLCNHYNLPTNPLPPGTGVTNPDGDSCGDLNAGAVVPSFPLGTFVAVCETNPDSTNAKLHIGSCLGWKEPGGDKVCPLPDAKPNEVPNWATDSPDGFRFGTLYANKSKCNCDGFDVPITVVRPPNLTIAKTADSASVSAGSQIGFTVTLGNTGLGPAQNVAVSDPLPSGTGVSWSIETPVTGWSITGSAPSQTLVFSAVSFAKNATSTVHVISSTTSASCKLYTNTATASLTNGTAPAPVTATTTVGCPTIGITKTPASQTKNAGESFSWTVTLTNNGPGTASGANISDPLPTLTGVSYALGSGSDATCAINSGTLTCGPKDLALNGTIVAVIDATTTAGTSCSASGITNTATGKATGVSDVQASATTTLNCPSIGITKTPASQTKSAGESFSWTVTLTNSGDGTAVGANMSDPLPVVTGVSYALGAGSDATCAINSGTLTCGPKDLAKNGTIVAIINATTTAGTSCAANGFTNTATGKATGVSDVQASATVTLNCPSIGITKTPASQTKNAGESFSWTVTLTNSGDGTAVGANISDPLPVVTGVSYALGAGSDASCAITSGTLTCGPKDLAKNGTIVAIINATTTAGTSCASNGFTNTATGKATGVSDVQASATVTLNCPSIGITKTPASQTKNAGESFSWTVTLTNSGAGTAVGANINDPLPVVTGVSYSLGAGSDATCAITAGTLTCGPKDLAANGTLVAVVNATTTAGTSCAANGFTNTATGKATGVSDVQASATVTLNCPSLGITKTPASQTKNAGESFSWTVTLTNSGAGTAAGANISDPLPVVTGVSYALGAGSDASCAITAGTLTCGPTDLAPNGTLVAVINATTTAGTSCAANGFTNTATGKATGVSDVQASATVTLNCPSIGITKTPASQTKSAGESFSWTVTLTNSGAGTAAGANISDPLPVVTGVSYSLGAGSDATCAITAGTLTCGPKDLAQNGTIVAVIDATTTAGTSCAANGFTNTATGKATGVSDVQASATVTLNCPSVAITKTPTTQTVASGSPFSWTVTFSNTGAGTAFGAAINDPLPVVSGVSYSLGAGSDATCAITAGTLACGPKDLAPNGTIVAVIDATTTAGQGCSANGFTNTATGSATGLSNVQATATTILTCPQVGGLIAPTQTTCEQFALGTAPSEPGLFAGLKGSVINNVSPGVVFYFATVTVPAGGGTINILQSDTRADGKSPPFPLLQVAQGQAYVKTFNSSTNQCSTVGTFNLSDPNAPTITIANAGTYIIQIKYSPNSLTGYSIPNPPVAAAFPVHYVWGSTVNGGSTVGAAAIDLNKK